jgi:hypothetical protein
MTTSDSIRVATPLDLVQLVAGLPTCTVQKVTQARTMNAAAPVGSLSIPEFPSTENAIDLGFLFGPSSIADGHTHSSNG